MSELIILPVEQRIESALQKENITEKLIAEMKANFLPMRLKSLEDKEGYVEIVDNRKKVKKFLSDGKNLFKNGREDAIAEQRAWVAKEKWFEGEVRPILTHLEGEEQKYEAEEERKKADKKRKQEANVINRSLQLTKMGAILVGDKLVLETAEVDMLLLREADDDTFNTIILPEFQPIFDRLEAEKAEAARIEKEKKEKEEADRKALEEAQAFLIKQKEEFEAQQAEFKRKQDEAEAEEKRKKDAMLLELLSSRRNQLTELGFKFSFQIGYYFDPEIVLENWELEVWSDNEWDAYITKITPQIEAKKQQAEQKRLDEIAEQQRMAAERAIEEERERVRLQKEKDEQEAKQKALEEQERFDKANDSQKWVLFVDRYFSDITFPEMKNRKYREIVAIAKEKIEEIKKLH